MGPVVDWQLSICNPPVSSLGSSIAEVADQKENGLGPYGEGKRKLPRSWRPREEKAKVNRTPMLLPPDHWSNDALLRNQLPRRLQEWSDGLSGYRGSHHCGRQHPTLCHRNLRPACPL